ncbi:MAG: glycosyltransferase [Gammaproteobacteria bacterium]|nr:glycosyltransferase [Gammaproteobacteria bacterium]
MTERGHEVDIYVTDDSPIDAIPTEVVRHRLMARTRRISASSNRVFGFLQLLGLMVFVGWRAPAVIARIFGRARGNGWVGVPRLLYAGLCLIRRGQPSYDVVHAQFGTYGLLAQNLVDVGACSGAVVTSFRGYDLGKALAGYHTAYRQLFESGALFLPVSKALARRLVDAGCDPSKIQVHYSGIDCRYPPKSADAAPVGEVHVVSVARLVEKKGIQYAIDAVARARAAGRWLRYTVVGDGPLCAELHQLIRARGVARHVHLIGAQSNLEVLRLLLTAHIFLAPSVTAADGDEEGIPVVLLEAMAMGLPALSTTHGGIPELVEHDITGWLVPERDVDALAQRLIELIDQPSLRASMGRAARARVERDFDIERSNDKLVALYCRAANKSADIMKARNARALLLTQKFAREESSA